MDYNQLREILVNSEALYRLWKSTGLPEEEFILANRGLIEQSEKTRLQKEQARARQVKFFEKKKSEGKRFLSALVSAETYDRLTGIRDNSIQAGIPKNLGDVLGELLSGSQQKPDQKPDQTLVETQTEIPAPAQAADQDPADKPDVLEIIALHRKAGLTWPDVAKSLNDAGLFTSTGKPWTGANAMTYFNRSQKS